MISFPEPTPEPTADIPAGTTVTPHALRLLIAACRHLGRKLTAQEAVGVIERGVLEVFEDAGGKVTISIRDSGDELVGPELTDVWFDELLGGEL